MRYFLLKSYNTSVIDDKITSSSTTPDNMGISIDGASFTLGIITGILIAFFVSFIIYTVTSTIKEKKKKLNKQNNTKSDK